MEVFVVARCQLNPFESPVHLPPPPVKEAPTFNTFVEVINGAADSLKHFERREIVATFLSERLPSLLIEISTFSDSILREITDSQNPPTEERFRALQNIVSKTEYTIRALLLQLNPDSDQLTQGVLLLGVGIDVSAPLSDLLNIITAVNLHLQPSTSFPK